MKLYVFDLDGTLANLNHRLHHIKNGKKNWDAFFDDCSNDLPIKWVIDFANSLWQGPNYIWILSGRSDRTELLTRQWLRRYDVHFDDLFMRKDGDHRPDEILKLEMLKEKLAANPTLELRFIVDDRQRVVDMWRKNGFNVLQCAAWDEEADPKPIASPNLTAPQ